MEVGGKRVRERAKSLLGQEVLPDLEGEEVACGLIKQVCWRDGVEAHPQSECITIGVTCI